MCYTFKNIINTSKFSIGLRFKTGFVNIWSDYLNYLFSKVLGYVWDYSIFL